MDVLKFELDNPSSQVGGRSHLIKSQETVNGLKKLLNRGALSPWDASVINKILDRYKELGITPKWAMKGSVSAMSEGAVSQEQQEREAFLSELAAIDSNIDEIIDEHRDDDPGGDLPAYLIAADIDRWAVSNVESDSVRDVFSKLEEGFRLGTPAVQNLIAVGFVEGLPFSSEEAAQNIERMLGPCLRELWILNHNHGGLFSEQISLVAEKYAK